MRKELKVIVGEHDFKSFQAHDTRERTSVREIYKVSIKERVTGQKSMPKNAGYFTPRTLCVSITGNGFLYNMVRNIVGTTVDIGRGYLPPVSMKKIIAAKDRTKAGPTAPPQGLFLETIKY